MTFSPQYLYWGQEDFTSSDGATYLNPTEFEIVDGVVTLLPSGFTGTIHSYNTVWDPVSSWTIDNNMDTLTGITGQFSLTSATGNSSSITGLYGYSGATGQLSFYTSTVTPVTGSNGVYVSGSTSCYTYNGESFNVSKFNRITIEASVRSLSDSISHSLSTVPSTGIACHGIYIGSTVGDSFVEIHPEGLKLHGVSGAILPGDFSSSARRIRIVRLSTAILLMADDGRSLYVPTGILPSTNTSQYITFGAFPVITGGCTFTGTGVSGFHAPTSFYDPLGQTGIGGIEGTVLWDDVKIKVNEAVSALSNGVVYSWPTGVKTMYTAPWYPNKNINKYLGATIDSIQIGKSYTTISAQYKAPSGTSGTAWTDYNGSLTVYNNSSSSNYLDLSNVPVYNGFDNAIRFKVLTSGNGNYVTPQITSITAIAKPKNDYVNVIPNWKLSALPKDIFFTVDRAKFKETIPPAHYQDEIYLHNEANISISPTGSYVTGDSFNLASGQVLSLYGSTGLVGIPDGIYGSAIRNFNPSGSITGPFISNSYREIGTGIYVGNLINTFDIYPAVASLPTGATGAASCIYTVDQFVNSDGDIVTAQTVKLQGWNDLTDATKIGLTLTGLVGPSVPNLVNIYNGVIQISRGPGVYATINDGSTDYNYFIDGNLYRTPKPFSCAALLTGSSASTTLRLGFGSRPVSTAPDPARWGPWTNTLQYHDKNEFTVFALTGSTVQHSYLQYTSTGDVSRTNSLNNNSVYNTVSYQPIRRDSVICEGYIRPYGITGNVHEAILFQDISPDNRGLTLYLNKSGELRTTVDLNICTGALGFTGTGVLPICTGAAGLARVTGQAAPISLTSDSNSIVFGDWNHIGVYQETRALGDTYTSTNQPLIAAQGSYHGARTAKLYLEINGNIVNSHDIGVDPYISNIISGGTVAALYPTTNVSTVAWPHIPFYATSGTSRTGTLGKEVVCDFDHFRFGIHNSVDTKAWSNVNGAKITPPTFTPWNAVKMPAFNSGDISQRQYAHIYRFDHPTTFQGWDDGYALNHALVKNYKLSAELTGRGLKPISFVSTVQDGPKGRPALRLGPGANILIPWNSLDERMFNGTGSCSLTFGSSAANTGMFYANSGAYIHPNMTSWYTGVSGYANTSSNSRMVFGGKFRLHNYPTGSLYGDLMTFEESDANQSYATASIYIAVDSNGLLTYGTRRTAGGSIYDGSTNRYVVGPFTGTNLNLETWYSIGIDASLGIGSGYLKLYTGTTLVSSANVILNSSGDLNYYTGRAIGYHGHLGTQTNTVSSRSNFVIGGQQPYDVTLRTFQWMDMDVSECYIGFPVTGSAWDMSRFAYTGDGLISGHTDLLLKNSSTRINPLVGTGIGLNAFYYAKAHYPPTSFSDAGEHLLWATSTAGNDPENFNDFGIQLYDTVPFNNAESYYVVYEDNSASQAFGSTDSPIQLVPQVPPEGVNLALVSNKEWTSDYALSSFDLSDKNYSNITNLNGDSTVQNFSTVANGITSSGSIASEDIRLSSISVWDYNSTIAKPGYFVHLIGGSTKGVYAPSAYGHSESSVSYQLYHLNQDKIQSLITLTDADGNIIPFDTFPYKIISSPYPPDVNFDNVTGSLFGYGPLVTGEINDDGLFTCLLIAHEQTIGKSVFIHYPSKYYNSTVINLQDYDVYNPVPLMKKIDYSNALSGLSLSAPTGSFSVVHGDTIKGLNVTVWGANLTGWA